MIDEICEQFGLTHQDIIKAVKALRPLVTQVQKNGEPKAVSQNVIHQLQDLQERRVIYDKILKNAKENQSLKKLNLRSLQKYLVDYCGEKKLRDGSIYRPWLYALVTLTQNYSMNKVHLISPTRTIPTFYHQLHLGEAQAGKSFNTADILVGSEKDGIPPHGIPFVYHSFDGASPAAFVQNLYVLEQASDYGHVYINEEVSDWTAKKDVINNIKKVLERKKVTWQLKTKLSIPSFVTKGNFIMTANERYSGETSLNDENSDLNALMSRCITVGWKFTDEISDFNIERTLKINPRMAKNIRQFMVLLHNITHNNQFNVTMTKKQFSEIVNLRKSYIKKMKSRQDINSENVVFVKTGIRDILNVCKFAANLALMNYFHQGKKTELKIDNLEMKFAKMLLIDIMDSREKELEAQSTTSKMSRRMVSNILTDTEIDNNVG